MCGVVAGVGADARAVAAGVAASAHRGPDHSAVVERGACAIGHARLAIVDLDARSDQPFSRGDVLVAYNGELWNHRELRLELEDVGEVFLTPGDTEVFAAVLDRLGEAGLPRTNGMFAAAWTTAGDALLCARDRHGEVPLHYAPCAGGGWLVASELKALAAAGARLDRSAFVEPGEVVELRAGAAPLCRRWHEQPAEPADLDLAEASRRLRALVEAGARERAMSDVPVCTLLSGGIDSSAVAAFLAREIPGLVAYVAKGPGRGGPDLASARQVAERVGIELREVEVQAPSADDLAEVVRVIEMPHKAQVEIAWACMKLADRMRADGFKVTFSGEGSDELWASYGFAYHALAAGAGWHEYRRDLFRAQHRKNFARCNKVFMSRSIECRLPFLHPPLVDLALSLPEAAVRAGKNRPKAVLQDAVRDLLPARAVDRPKMPFQDGAGLKAGAASAVADPKRFYAAEHLRAYRGAPV